MLAVVLLMYALTAKRKIIIGIQIISGAVLSVSITTNVIAIGAVCLIGAYIRQIALIVC